MTIITSKSFADAVRKGETISNPRVAKEAIRFRPSDTGNVLTFVFSSRAVDRSGDRVFPEGIDFSDYIERNPLILLHHDMHSFPIGKTTTLAVEGDELVGTIEFFVDLDEADIGTNARAAVELIKRGTMGISITFVPKEFELNTTDGIDFKACAILEVSCVTVPCNTDAFLVADTTVIPDLTVSNSIRLDRVRKAAARRRAIDLLD